VLLGTHFHYLKQNRFVKPQCFISKLKLQLFALYDDTGF